MPEFLTDWLHRAFGEHPWPILVIGLFGQLLFASRFFVQWIASERAGRSVMPLAFWWISVLGSLLVLSYGILTAEPVVILGQIGLFVYLRNLMLIRRARSAPRA
ncbi:MAG: hypothetical protein EYC70_11830 [Planctomycetota bacterium]|nr:MAG: hypothetical protein EYC70_11830 [Planctomycetota bacterium]